MKLVVTGGLGFIGSNFIRHILGGRKDARVVNLDLCTYAGHPENLEDLAAGSRYKWVKGDVADPRAMGRVLKDADAVIHFAAETHVDRSILSAAPFVRTNVVGAQVLFDQALKNKVSRVVFVSTDEVYGSVPEGRFSREADVLEPNSPYAASKSAGDLLARAYFVTHGLPVIVTRSSNNFGPFQHPEKALPLMITNWLEGKPYPLYGDGLNVRDWLYVLDHCRALEFLLERGKLGEIYNIGGIFSCSNRELVERVREIMNIGESMTQPVPDRPGHDRRYALDAGKLKSLGFVPAHEFDDALRGTVEWFRTHGSWWKPLKKGRAFTAYYGKQYGREHAAGVRAARGER